MRYGFRRSYRYIPFSSLAFLIHSPKVEDEAKGLLQAAMKQLALSARAFHRVLKVARTIADLAGVERIGVVHLAEALQHRPRAQV